MPKKNREKLIRRTFRGNRANGRPDDSFEE
jgi:hypothetical protein